MKKIANYNLFAFTIMGSGLVAHSKELVNNGLIDIIMLYFVFLLGVTTIILNLKELLKKK